MNGPGAHPSHLKKKKNMTCTHHVHSLGTSETGKNHGKSASQEVKGFFAATWMNSEGIMQSEVSQTEKDKYCMISLICGI